MTRDTQASQTPRNRLTSLPPKQARILIVDDDPDILQLLNFSLAQEGYKIQTASSGREAIQQLDEFSPDVLCIDYMMPEMNGQEVARQIRDRRDMLYVPIIMLTAAGQQGKLKLDSLDSGVDAYLIKPISREELKATIRTLLRVKAAQDRMLEALERVAEVQDELLQYERQQGQYEAMQATIATFTLELDKPVRNAQIATDQLEKLVAEGEAQTSIKQLQTALEQVQSVIERLNAATEFNTKEGHNEQILLDLDQVASDL